MTNPIDLAFIALISFALVAFPVFVGLIIVCAVILAVDLGIYYARKRWYRYKLGPIADMQIQ